MIARLYANENFPLPVVVALRGYGHDVLTSLDAGKANEAIPDVEVLRHASADQRAVITHNRQDFIHIHRFHSDHCGIIVCTVDTDFPALAARIHAHLQAMDALHGQLLRINRGN
jgi:predicted nuclease of predicted toxin-antitoxin system